MNQMQNLGGMGGILGLLPGVGKMKKQIEAAGLDDSIFKRQQAIILSMTKRERRAPKLMNASRKKRVAAGSGTSVQEVNKLLKMHIQMAGMMKKMGRGKGMLGRMFGAGAAPDAAELERMQAELGGLDPNALPPELKDMAQGKMPALPKGLPGLGGGGGLPGLGAPRGLPGLGGGGFKGLPGFAKKKK